MLTKIKNFLSRIFSRSPAFPRKATPVSWPLRLLQSLITFLRSWWRLLIIAFAAFVILYYPLGGCLTQNIDTSVNYEITPVLPEQSATVETMAFLINREVNDHLWTPNLPFFFPAYFLDNMPSFQSGIIKSTGTMASAFARRLSPGVISSAEDVSLQNAAKLLKYPGNIWMFAPGSTLKPAPSSSKQYRKARRQLLNYNAAVAEKQLTFSRSAQDLEYFLLQIAVSLSRSTAEIENQIREHSSSWLDTKADNIFFYNQGKSYAWYLLIKALGNDYKNIIVETGEYENWTRLLKALEEASSLSPFLIRNAELNDSLAPNHLSYLGFYLQKAENITRQIAGRINR